MWFRSDLRTADNTALRRACAADRRVIGVFLVSPGQWREHDWGGAKIDFMLRNVAALSQTLGELNIPLRVVCVDRFADAPRTLMELARHHGCGRLCFNREYEVNERRRDEAVTAAFTQAGCEVIACHDQTIVPPDADALRTGTGRAYTVFTPFRRRWLSMFAEESPPRPGRRPGACEPTNAKSDCMPAHLDGVELSPVDASLWPAGEAEARRRLDRFIRLHIDAYDRERDDPAEQAVSTLSPYLATGVISPRQCLAAAKKANDGRLDGGNRGASTWITQLIWREFYRHVMLHYPRVSMGRAFQRRTERVSWRDDPEGFARWCQGRTGVPIVDAGMRQLNRIGWMHNRLRMITAMYLTKDLLIDWRLGERYFMQRLVDGDLANNNGGWQWSASTGTDAAPYFRIFNPYSQSRKIDPRGRFIRTWCPELADLPDRTIHEPSRLPREVRDRLDYPPPLADHAAARRRAIEAYRSLGRHE